jgi:hypothetical protein
MRIMYARRMATTVTTRQAPPFSQIGSSLISTLPFRIPTRRTAARMPIPMLMLRGKKAIPTPICIVRSSLEDSMIP